MSRRLFLCCLLMVMPASVFAQGKAVGMAGAYSLAARGAEAPSWNPATLAWSSQLHIQIASIRLLATNNSFSYSDYKRWNGKTWDDQDKAKILASIPGPNFEIQADTKVMIPGLAWGSWAVTAETHGGGKAGVPKEFARLVFFGNTPEEAFDLDGAGGEGLAYSEYRISHARPIGSYKTWDLVAGGSFKYLQGWAYAEVTEASGELVTTIDALKGHGIVEELTSLGGSGFAFDFGVAAKRDDGWQAGLALRNLFGSIKWTKETKWYRQTVDADSVTLNDFEDDSDAVVDTSEDGPAPDFSRSLAPSLTLGIARPTAWAYLEMNIEQGLQKGPMTTTTPRLSLGLARSLWWRFQGRMGLAFGGIDGPVLAFGSGLNLWGIELEGAYYSTGTLNPFSGKGAGVGFSIGYR
ncbi:MAG: hypothetical protein KJ970_08440 [Candidatus Eisenbacteria bacterium]|uniref:DUF5723 domain-containing protein n=1 Tax=Eiseniibacteriota bacterium TaxID=2212470 RepID=A0A948RWP7_UNCEI|nr:hypothetical protein [Candidatus Eisenbacteria bacterium]MBU1950522.1 hypothetical protein [Candidatus Eisenbacteria bacterium]MBU2690943.1 hypothetical protein [Candidatus Eisenbacteria bacterium]